MAVQLMTKCGLHIKLHMTSKTGLNRRTNIRTNDQGHLLLDNVQHGIVKW